MAPSWWQILIVVALFVVLFGRGKISALMSDVAKGVKSLRSGLAEIEAYGNDEVCKPKAIEHQKPASKPRARARVPAKKAAKDRTKTTQASPEASKAEPAKANAKTALKTERGG